MCTSTRVLFFCYRPGLLVADFGDAKIFVWWALNQIRLLLLFKNPPLTSFSIFNVLYLCTMTQ